MLAHEFEDELVAVDDLAPGAEIPGAVGADGGEDGVLSLDGGGEGGFAGEGPLNDLGRMG